MTRSGNFSLFSRKMELEQLPPLVIDTFGFYYEQVVTGNQGYIDEEQISSLSTPDLPDYHSLPYPTTPDTALARTAIIKLNGGLGTTMRLRGAKSAIAVKNGLTFLDITARQVKQLRSTHGATVPLILMNSFSTHQESLDLLRAYPCLTGDIPSSFLQHKFPKIMQETLLPAEYPADRKMEWNPPGHGDLYTALVTSGLIKTLLAQGFRFAFVSNIDNLGATLDLRILEHFAASGTSFLMEVAQRTVNDSKGGHLALRRSDNRLILREYAQCPPRESDLFQDIRRHGCFNTNNLWINLESLNSLLESTSGVPRLPLIRNEKTLNPLDAHSPRVYQLETAMGAAISLFNDSAALLVPRSRFIPVKRCDDLLCVQSDYYVLDDSFHLISENGLHNGPLTAQLDPRYFGTVDDLTRRFPFGPPSLAQCNGLVVRGDVFFGRDVRIRGGQISIINERPTAVTIPDYQVITKDLIFD